MYTTYILKSLKEKRFYTGYTSDIVKRLQQHNCGRSTYTKRYIPWEVVYTEEFITKGEAIERERYFKSCAGRVWLKNKFKL